MKQEGKEASQISSYYLIVYFGEDSWQRRVTRDTLLPDSRYSSINWPVQLRKGEEKKKKESPRSDHSRPFRG